MDTLTARNRERKGYKAKLKSSFDVKLIIWTTKLGVQQTMTRTEVPTNILVTVISFLDNEPLNFDLLFAPSVEVILSRCDIADHSVMTVMKVVTMMTEKKSPDRAVA